MSARQPKLLVVEDDAALLEALTDTLNLAGYQVDTAANAEAALALLRRETPGLVLTDVQMPGMDGHGLLKSIKAASPGLPVVLMTAYGQIEKAVEAMRDGAADYLPKPFEPDRLLAVVARYLRPVQETGGEALIAEDPASRAVLDLARRVAATDATVLLTGESGVGKEVYARFLHRHSNRAKGPFVAVNCAAIPENLLEATLFGYEKGAFTGATGSQPGKFEQAQGGTLLLDEITELPLHLQAKLLRVLQEREAERVGGRSPVQLDVRVIAASNRDLEETVRLGRFRDDLYYRLNVFPLEIPPLRERPKDILPLAEHFLERFAATVGRSRMRFSAAARAELTGYDWPGNIRELGNVVQRAMILAPAEEIGPEHLMLPRSIPRPAAAEVGGKAIKDVERDMILQTLERCGGSRKQAAEELGISERTLRYKLQRYRAETGEDI
ncbi:two-component system response regulator FlrC [Sulfuritortus calidifontis]|uniref:Two-component system response regulator FlrC n=1 Tax=Sulfuritortus calidifontis TaxID=1914471 RepID=A0A4R3JYM0_9PROT|nr:sigma-54 dependent transcriptional regulator [Sulfuritortus calidifontis]TCS73913.1 two-component system response regulator FlrC [Sulfuritortus calidifontis]